MSTILKNLNTPKRKIQRGNSAFSKPLVGSITNRTSRDAEGRWANKDILNLGDKNMTMIQNQYSEK